MNEEKVGEPHTRHGTMLFHFRSVFDDKLLRKHPVFLIRAVNREQNLDPWSKSNGSEKRSWYSCCLFGDWRERQPAAERENIWRKHRGEMWRDLFMIYPILILRWRLFIYPFCSNFKDPAGSLSSIFHSHPNPNAIDHRSLLSRVASLSLQ